MAKDYVLERIEKAHQEENAKLYKEKTILENMLKKIPQDVIEKYCI